MGTLSVGAKDARKGGMILCSEPKSLHSLSITNPMEKGWVQGRIFTRQWTWLASHWCLKRRDGKKETRRRPWKVCEGRVPTLRVPSRPILENSSATERRSFEARIFRRKTQLAWVWTFILFEPLKVSARMSNYVFAGFIWTLHCASIFQLLFNHWSAGSNLEKSGFPPFSAHVLINFVIHLIIQRYTVSSKFLENKPFVVFFPVPESSMISFRTPACYNGPLQLGSFMSILQCDIDKIINKLFRLCIPFSTA